MYDLKIDTDALQTAINGYEKIVNDINSIKTGLETVIQQLGDTYWQSTAGQKFIEMYNDDWVKHVDLYVKVLEFLKGQLISAKDDYTQLIEYAKQLDIQIEN